MIQLPVDPRLGIYKSCCGKRVCGAGIDEQERVSEKCGLASNCPYCRASNDISDEERNTRIQERADKGDSLAMSNLANYHR